MTGTKPIQAIDYVILPCEDIASSRAFYLDVMRFPLEEDQEDWVKFRVGSSYLTLRPRGRWLCWHDGAANANAVAVQLAFRVAPLQVDECYEEMLKRGVDVLDAPKDQDFGHRTLFFRDPEGNIIEIYAEI